MRRTRNNGKDKERVLGDSKHIVVVSVHLKVDHPTKVPTQVTPGILFLDKKYDQ